MAPPLIQIDQATKPAGVAGQAREDLSTGIAVTLLAVGGPYAQYQWEFVDVAVNILTPAVSAAAFGTPTAVSTTVTPIDLPGTYSVRLSVDSGSGLGATIDDVAEITFYAGPALSADPAELPRREPAFRETTQHNVPDGINAGGNVEGWAREWRRWFATLVRLVLAKSYARARVQLTGGGATVQRNLNINSVTRVSTGVCDVAFVRPMTGVVYTVNASPRGTPGMLYVDTETANGFRIYRADQFGALVDADFSFEVGLGVAA